MDWLNVTGLQVFDSIRFIERSNSFLLRVWLPRMLQYKLSIAFEESLMPCSNNHQL